jgi:hypothetical protein
MLTPRDIRDTKLKAGYKHVNIFKNGTFRAQAYGGKRTQAGHAWYGPVRKTAREAAQDYCNYINSGKAPLPPSNKSAGHKRPSQPRRSVPSDIRAARGMIRDWEAQQKKGVQGYVYCIAQVTSGGGIQAVKIGYSVAPAKRVPELQTGNPDMLKLLCMKKGTENDEKALHRKYRHRNILQEWFSPTKEMLLEFDLDPEGNPYPAAQSGGQPKEAKTK